MEQYGPLQLVDPLNLSLLYHLIEKWYQEMIEYPEKILDCIRHGHNYNVFMEIVTKKVNKLKSTARDGQRFCEGIVIQSKNF